MKWFWWAIFAFFIIGLAAVALPQLWYPFGFDQQVYAACGDVIRRGGVPIRDCFETKQPGVMAIYALPMLFTRAPAAVHAFTLLWQAGTSVVLALVARKVFRSWRSALIAASLYWLIYAGINYWSMDQAETFANVFLLLAFWFLLRGTDEASQPDRSLFVAGLFIGIAFWFKYVFALIGIVFGAVFVVRLLLHRPRTYNPVRFAFLYGGGVLIVIALVLAYYAMVPGGLSSLGDQLTFLRDNFPLAPPRPWQQVIEQIARFANNGADLSGDFKATLGEQTKAANVFGGGFPLVLVLSVFGVLRGLVPTRSGSARGIGPFAIALLLAYLGGALATVIWQGNYIQYHFTLLHVPIVLLAAGAVAAATDAPAPLATTGTRQNSAQQARIFDGTGFIGVLVAVSTLVFVVTAALLIFRMTPMMRDAWQNVMVERKPVAQMYLEGRQGANLAVADYLREHTTLNDSISIFGDAPWVYTLSERRNATNFAFVNVWIKKRGSPSYELFVSEWKSGLEFSQPIYVILTRENFPWPNNSYLEDYKLALPIFEYVEAHYNYEGEVGPFLLYRRR